MAAKAIRRFSSFGIRVILLLLVVTACKDNQPTGTSLPFSVLAQGDGDTDGTSYPGQYSELFAIQSLTDIEQIRSWVPVAVQTQLETLDYNRQFAVVVFQGEQRNTQYGVQVTEVSYFENTVNVFVDLMVSPEGTEVGDIIASPYQVVWVDISESDDPLVAFNLVVNE